MYLYIRACIYTHMYTQLRIHTYICIYIYICEDKKIERIHMNYTTIPGIR